MDLPPAGPLAPAARLWAGLDKPGQEAFRQAWESAWLIDLANEAGGPDNIACVVADVVEPRPGSD